MAIVVNTNVSSLNAQRNLVSTGSLQARSLQRLSSGLRINSAKDDAAGLAISDRMNSQVRGLNQAVRNANDGISLSQTAEGALQESTSILQRVRELAIQSANATNSASDRAALQGEVGQLISELDRIATTTSFNGIKMLDGTFSAKAFQIGSEANQTISLSVAGARSSSLGSWGGVSSSVVSAAVVDGTAPVAWTASSTIAIDGTSIGASVADANIAGWSAGSAAAKTAAINAKTVDTGVTATATTSVAGAAPIGSSSLASGGLKLNGIAVGPIASATTAVGQGSNAADAINAISTQSGVTATYSTTSGALTLTAADGRDIKIEAGTATAAGVAQVLNATGLTAADTGSTAATAGTDTVTFGIKAVVGETVTLNGVIFTFADTAGADAYTVVDATHVTVGTDIAGGSVTASADALEGAFDAAKVTGQATATALAPLDIDNVAGVATVTDTRAGLAATVGRTTAASTAAVVQDVTGLNGAVDANAYNTNGGTISLFAPENFTLTGTGTGLADGGLGSYAPALSQLSSAAVDTVVNANSTISIVDAALSQINSMRGDLGAIQNRFESAISNMMNVSENISAAKSRVVDADFASETANLTKAQILQQAGLAMLAQANQVPQAALTLLQG
jgi:flagellin